MNEWILISNKPPVAPCVLGRANEKGWDIAMRSVIQWGSEEWTHWHPLPPPPKPEHPAIAAWGSYISGDPARSVTHCLCGYLTGYRDGLLEAAKQVSMSADAARRLEQLAKDTPV